MEFCRTFASFLAPRQFHMLEDQENADSQITKLCMPSTRSAIFDIEALLEAMQANSASKPVRLYRISWR